MKLKRLVSIFGAVALLAGMAVPLLSHRTVSADQITSRSLTLEADQDAAFCTGLTTNDNNTMTNGLCDANGDQLPDGGSTPSNDPGGGGTVIPAYVSDLLSFTVPTASDVDTITFTYCTTAANVPGGTQCDIPANMDASKATLGDEGGITGWSISSKSPNSITMSGTAQTLSTVSGLRFDDVANPSAANTTFFVRIATSSSGTTVDTGTVAASTTNLIQISGTMPESLVFCTGATVDINLSGVPDCTTATSGVISFNQLFDPNTTSWTTSQMVASTNAGKGYAITVNGPTLTSGTNTITGISTTDVSRPGTKQFGLNLIDDAAPTAPTVTDPTIGAGSPDPITYYNGDNAGTGAAINPLSDGTNYNAKVSTGFDGTGDSTNNYPTYTFVPDTDNTVATSNYSGTGAIASNTQRYTVTYIANVSGNLPAGTYKTTLTYICTPEF